MNDSFGGGFDPETTIPGEGGEAKKDGILPVVIKQLLLMEDSVTMFGTTYPLITTVAIIRDIQFSSTKITYRLEDHTGQINAHFWVESEETKQPKVTKNAYARIIGNMRNTGEQKCIVIYHANEIENINELTTHQLEVLYVRYKAEAMQAGPGAANAFPTRHANGIASSTTSMLMDTTPAAAAATDDPYGLTGKNKLVYGAIKADAPGNETGISRGELDRKFPQIPKMEMDQIIDFMTSEGIIYTTIDSDHYLPCDG